MQRVERELFESSLASARSVLELMGQSAEQTRQQADRFRQHNTALFETMRPLHHDRSKVIAAVKAGRQQLEAQMAQERLQAASAQSGKTGKGPGQPKPDADGDRNTDR